MPNGSGHNRAPLRKSDSGVCESTVPMKKSKKIGKGKTTNSKDNLPTQKEMDDAFFSYARGNAAANRCGDVHDKGEGNFGADRRTARDRGRRAQEDRQKSAGSYGKIPDFGTSSRETCV